MVYSLVVLLRSEFSISLIFRVLGISKSAFYAWQRGENYPPKTEKSAVVKEVFEDNRKRYGARRIVAELTEKGLKMGRFQVCSLMKSANLVAIQPKSFVPKTTDSRHHMKRSPNLLLTENGDRKRATRPHEILVGDITYLPILGGGFVYLATFQDAFTRVIVGWELMKNMDTELVINALQKSINRNYVFQNTIIHTDGGGQYASKRFRDLLKKHNLKQSMTRKNNHYDNAMGESFFSRAKSEVLENGVFDRFEDAYTEIFEYIEVYYNKKRRHSSIGYDFPERFEKKWLENDKKSYF